MKERIRLTRERRDDMIGSIKEYYRKEREEEIGDLAAGLILEFVVQELAPEFYNQGVMDSYKFMTEKVEDIQSLLL